MIYSNAPITDRNGTHKIIQVLLKSSVGGVRLEIQIPSSLRVLDRNLLNLIQCKLVIGSIVQLCRARGFVSGNLLRHFKRSLVFP